MESLGVIAAEPRSRQKIPHQESRLLAALFEEFRSGEDRDGLVRHCHPWIVGYFLRNYRGMHISVAEDLAQQVWMKVLQKKDQLSDPYSVKSWLRTIMRRTAINEHLHGYHRRFLASLGDNSFDIVSKEPAPLGLLLVQSRQGEVHKALNKLGNMDRDTLVAFYFRHQSLKEMAEVFQAPVGTIKRRLHVARKRLHRVLIELTPCGEEWTDNPR